MGRRSQMLGQFGDDFAWSLLDATPDAILIVSATGEIAFVNDHAAELFASDPDDLVDRGVDELLPEHLRAAHRAHRTRYRAEPAVREMGVGLELQARRRDGSEFPVEISLSPVHLGDETFVVAAVRDTTERVRADEHFHRVLETLDASDDGMFIFDAATLRYSFVNEGAVRLVGYDRDELLHMTPMHLNPYSTEKDYEAIVDALSRDPLHPVIRHAKLLRKDGVEVPVEKTYKCAPTGSDGTRWIISLARDMTERLASEAELRASQEALRDTERDLAISEDRERIARDLHDTVIQRLFGEGMSLQAVMATVDESTRARLEATVDGIDQTIKELRSAIFSLQPSGTRAGGRRGQLVAMLTEASEALGFEPRMRFDGPIETIDDATFEQLIPVLRESLSNVARHARARSVRVAVTVGTELTLTVADDGIGVPDEVLGGRGLVNMAERAAQLGGKFSITTRASGGAMFTWTVPLPERKVAPHARPPFRDHRP